MERLSTGIFSAPHVRTEAHDGCIDYHVQNRTGSGVMRDYEAFPGIHLMYTEMDMTLWPPEDTVTPLNAIELNHCREGRCEVEYDGKTYYVAPGDFCLAVKDKPETASAFPTGHYSGIGILIYGGAVCDGNDTLMRTFGVDIGAFYRRYFPHGEAFLLHSNRTVEHIFSELYTVREDARSAYIRLKLLELLLFLSDEENLSDRLEQKRYPVQKVQLIKRMERHITAHLDSRLTMRGLSERFAIPVSTLKVYFAAVYGKPVATFIRDARMRRAAELLRTTDSSIMDIAAAVGYDNASKFAAAFRSVTGCNPVDWRNGAQSAHHARPGSSAVCAERRCAE